MTYSESIKSGFRLVNEKWQLIAIQAGMMLANCIGFFIMVGIPLGVAFVIFGLDLTGLAEMKDLLNLFRNPAELLSKYFWLILTVAMSFLLYIAVVTTVWLYVFSGSAGIIGRSVAEPSFKFSMRDFFSEAKRLFFPLMWFSLVIGLVFLLVAFALGFLSGGVAALVSLAKSQDSTLALFIGIFFSLVVLLTGAGMILIVLAITVYGVAILYFKRQGAMKTLKEAVLFLWENPKAFWLYIIVLCGYILVSFILMLVVYPFNLIPIIGTIISLPFQILLYVVQGYLGLVILAVVFTSYYNARNGGNRTDTGEPAALRDGNSTRGSDTSLPQAPGQGQVHPGPAETGQD